jgi:predicted PurR-regulated permease PerM
LSDWLSRRSGLSYGWALAAVVAVLVLLTVGLGWLLANRLAVQAMQLSQELPQSLQRIQDYLEASPWGRFLLDKAPQAAESFAQPSEFWRVTGVVSGVTTFLVAAVVILFVGIFGAAEPAVYKRGLLYLVPPWGRPRVAQALDEVALNLRGWLVGQACLMLLIGVTTAAGLWLLGIPMALVLGLLAGILELVPYLGAWLSAVPAALIALLLGPWYLVMTLALYLGLHILEGYVLVPLIQRRAVHLPPALTLVAQLLLGELLGVLGLLVAAPLTVSAVVFLKRLYVEDALGDKSVEGPGEPDRVAPPLLVQRATADRTSPITDKE